ncbi:MAG: hypothetical protein JW969_19545 [Spirochaetales bacterium]|nr:hypothetical protein [Spirochaetales bacterium]
MGKLIISYYIYSIFKPRPTALQPRKLPGASASKKEVFYVEAYLFCAFEQGA